MKFLLKKLVLIILLGTLPLQAQAGWMPQWLSPASEVFQSITNFIKDHKEALIFGVGAFLCAGLVGGYFYHKNYKKPQKENNPNEQEPQSATINPQLHDSEVDSAKSKDSEDNKEKAPEPKEESKDKEDKLARTDSARTPVTSNSNNISPVHLTRATEGNTSENNHQIVSADKDSSTKPVAHSNGREKEKSKKGKEKLPTNHKKHSEKEEKEKNDKEKEKEKEDQKNNNQIHEEFNNWSYPTFIDWNKVCKHLDIYQLPTEFGHDTRNKKLAVTLKELEVALDCYLTILNNDLEVFQNPAHWVNQEVALNLIESLQPHYKSVFDPFVQKLVVKPGSTIAFHGDIHGDIHSLNAFIDELSKKGYLDNDNPFKIAHDKKDFYIIFLGDYTDRGWYGPEVIYTILRLKCANPDRVLMVRGNHEDATMNKKEAQGGPNGFFAQLKGKYHIRDRNPIFEKINKMYETLPLALYLGTHDVNETNYFLCCHGGVEIGFNPRDLLNHEANIAFIKLTMLDREKGLSLLVNDKNLFKLFKDNKPKLTPIELAENIIKNLETAYLEPYYPQGIITPLKKDDGKKFISTIGFQWNDYEVNINSEILRNWYFVKDTPGRGWVIGQTFNKAVLALQSDAHNKIRGVFRAHQHSTKKDQGKMAPMMERIFNTDHLDHDANIGVGKLWIPPFGPKPDLTLWDNIVCTFNVSPHTPYQSLGYRFDTYGILTTAEKFSDWTLEVHRIEVIETKEEEQKEEIVTVVAKPEKPARVNVTKHNHEEYTQDSTVQAKIGTTYEEKQPSKNSKDDLMNEFVLLDIEDEKITEEDLESIEGIEFILV